MACLRRCIVTLIAFVWLNYINRDFFHAAVCCTFSKLFLQTEANFTFSILQLTLPLHTFTFHDWAHGGEHEVSQKFYNNQGRSQRKENGIMWVKF